MSIWDSFLGIQDSSKVREDYLADIDTQGLHDNYQESTDFGKGLINYTSEYNRGMKRDYINQAMDFGENQMRNYQKSFAMGGRPVNQAMLNEKNQAVTKDSTNRGLMNFTNAYNQNLSKGQDFINQGMNSLNQYNQIYSNANQIKMGIDQSNTQKKAQFGQGMLALGINALAPGFGSIMGGGTFSQGYSMPRELHQMQMDYYNRPAPEMHIPAPRAVYPNAPSLDSGSNLTGGWNNPTFKLKTPSFNSGFPK